MEKIFIYYLSSLEELPDFEVLKKAFSYLNGTDPEKIKVDSLAAGFQISIWPLELPTTLNNSQINSEEQADRKARSFINAFNQTLIKLGTFPQHFIPSSSIHPFNIYSQKPNKFITHWYCEYGVYLKASEERQATIVENTRITVVIDSNLEVINFELLWRPIKSVSRVDPLNPKLYFQPFFEESEQEEPGKKQPFGPAIYYKSSADSNYLLPYYAGSNEPVIADSIFRQAVKDGPCPDDPNIICFVEQLPEWQIILLKSHRVDIEQYDGNHHILTNLYNIMNYYEVIRQQHYDGDFPVNSNKKNTTVIQNDRRNGETSTQTKIDYVEIIFEQNDIERKAAFIIKKEYGELIISAKENLTYPNCSMSFLLTYWDEETDTYIAPEEDIIYYFSCTDPNAPPPPPPPLNKNAIYNNPSQYNYENTFEPDATLVVMPTPNGLEITRIIDEDFDETTVEKPAIAVNTQLFEETLKQLDVPQINHVDAIRMGLSGTDIHVPSFDKALYNQKVNNRLTLNKLTGEIGEVNFKRNIIDYLIHRDLEKVPWRDRLERQRTGNHPIWDIQNTGPFDALHSVKASGRDTFRKRANYFDNGFNDITGGVGNRQELFNRAALNLLESSERPTNAEIANVRKKAQQQGKLAVNKDDVKAYRERAKNKLVNDTQNKFDDFLDAHLEKKPIQIKQKTYTNLAELDRAVNDGQITVEQKRVAFEKYTTRLSKKVIVSNGSTTSQISNIKNKIGSLSSTEVSNQIRPVDLRVARIGKQKAMIKGGVKSGAGGAVTNIFFEGLSTGEVNFKNTAVIAVSDFVGGALEVQTSATLKRVISSPVHRGWIGGGLSAGVAAPIAEVGIMLIDDNEYADEDYWARGSNAAVGGLISGGAATIITPVVTTFVTSVVVGSQIGAIGGPIGIVVGFVIGASSYYVYQSLLGEKVEGFARGIFQKLIGEFCLVGNWDVVNFVSFLIVTRRLTKADNIIIKTTGVTIKRINPFINAVELYFEIEPVSGEAFHLFGERVNEFVPRSMLKKY